MDVEAKSFCDYESRFFDIKGSEKICGKKKYLEEVKSQDTSSLKKNRLRDFSIINNPNNQ
jgi:hypothetical protein